MFRIIYEMSVSYVTIKGIIYVCHLYIHQDTPAIGQAHIRRKHYIWLPFKWFVVCMCHMHAAGKQSYRRQTWCMQCVEGIGNLSDQDNVIRRGGMY